jgi:hypothetical protein
MGLFDFLKGHKTTEPEYNYIDDDDEDEDSDESLSVWAAAEIWASNGMDEDYTFGYSEEELRKAL